MQNRTRWTAGRRRVMAGVVLVAVGVAAGCTDDPAPTPATDATRSASPTAPDGSGLQFTAPGANDYDGDVRVVVQSLTVEERTMELRVTLTPLDAAADDGARISVYDMLDGSPVLSDVERLTQYRVVGLPNDAMETDAVAAKTVVGEPVLYQAWFPAPDAEATSLDLVLHPSWPTVTDVPVTRG